MKNRIVVLLMLVFASCNYQKIESPKNQRESTAQSNQFVINRLIHLAQQKFNPIAQARTESLPNIPFEELEPTLEDMLTAFLCHKSPGGGETKILTISPVFTFTKQNDEENNAIISGEELTTFLNVCIDSVLSSVLGSSFEHDGTKMITAIDLEKTTESAHSVVYRINFLLLNQNSEFSTTGVDNNGPGILWDNCPFSNLVSWDVNDPIHRLLLNLALNSPDCNVYLRYRQRSNFPLSNHFIHPPHPSSYGQMLMPGFVWKLVYQGIWTINPTNPSSSNLYHSFYSNYGNYNFWNNVNLPPLLTGNQMNNIAKGIIYQGLNAQYFSHVSNKWDLLAINTNHNLFSGAFITGGIGQAIGVSYVWSQWKWIAVPDPINWSVIDYDSGITPLLNP